MKIDVVLNPALILLLDNPGQLITVDANFFIPPDRTKLGAQSKFIWEQFREIWVQPFHFFFPNIAVHESVLEELVEERVHDFVHTLTLSEFPPRMTLLKDSVFTPEEEAVRLIKERKIAEFTNFDPDRNNKQDRGEVKTLAHISTKGYLFFSSNDQGALRLIDQAEKLGTTLDELNSFRFYEGIYLLYKFNLIPADKARILYRYLYLLTKKEKEENPTWQDLVSQMDRLYMDKIPVQAIP